MNEKQTNIAVGVVAVVLAYALYTRMRPAAAAAPAARAPGAPVLSDAWNPATPGAYVSSDQLIRDAAAGVDYGAYASSDDLIYAVSHGGDKRDTGFKSTSVLGWGW